MRVLQIHWTDEPAEIWKDHAVIPATANDDDKIVIAGFRAEWERDREHYKITTYDCEFRIVHACIEEGWHRRSYRPLIAEALAQDEVLMGGM